MYKNVLQHIDNVAIWPILSFTIFFIFFIGLLIWVFTADKERLKKISELPLDDGDKFNDLISTNK